MTLKLHACGALHACSARSPKYGRALRHWFFFFSNLTCQYCSLGHNFNQTNKSNSKKNTLAGQVQGMCIILHMYIIVWLPSWTPSWTALDVHATSQIFWKVDLYNLVRIKYLKIKTFSDSLNFHVFTKKTHKKKTVTMCVCIFGFNIAFKNFSVISRQCLVVAGSSMLTFIVLPHWRIMSQTLGNILHPVTLYWHWVDQF